MSKGGVHSIFDNGIRPKDHAFNVQSVFNAVSSVGLLEPKWLRYIYDSFLFVSLHKTDPCRASVFYVCI